MHMFSRVGGCQRRGGKATRDGEAMRGLAKMMFVHSRLVIPFSQEFIFWTEKQKNTGFLIIFFCFFSEEFVHRSVVLEGS
jgi:hypothetical protein